MLCHSLCPAQLGFVLAYWELHHINIIIITTSTTILFSRTELSASTMMIRSFAPFGIWILI